MTRGHNPPKQAVTFAEIRNQAIVERQGLLDVLSAEMARETAHSEIPDADEIEDDIEVFEHTSASADAAKFLKLCNGDWRQMSYPSQSEADLALMRMFAAHSPNNAQVKRLFRMSALGKRDKAKKEKYLDRTLREARSLLSHDKAQIAHGRQLAESLFWKETVDDPSHFRLLTDGDLEKLPPQRWLVKGIIPDASVGTIFGQSGTFKSFLALDLMAHVANGHPWFGYRVKAAPAIYVPFEGRGGIPKRVAAWRAVRSRQAQRAVSTQMGFITEPMNLRNQGDRDKLVGTLTASGRAGGMLCIDTLAQAGAGIDENSSEGMGEMVAIFQELQHRVGGTVLVIHHSGKVQAAGMRGWSGLRGALDYAIECQRPDDSCKLDAQFRLDKVKDGEDGKIVPFSLLRVHLGCDEDGDDVSSLTVIPSVTAREETRRKADATRDEEDDDFVWQWVKREVDAAEYPTGRSLEGQREEQMRQHRPLTQKRLRDAVHRLRAASRLCDAEDKAPSGNVWMRAV